MKTIEIFIQELIHYNCNGVTQNSNCLASKCGVIKAPLIFPAYRHQLFYCLKHRDHYRTRLVRKENQVTELQYKFTEI